MDILLEGFEKTVVKIRECAQYREPPNAKNEGYHHTHDMCEIYFNVSGDVSFMVENHTYPVKRGSIIITRPNEFHHCIYHSNRLHEHFWILFSCANEKLLTRFYGRKAGEGNLIQLENEKIDRFIHVCRELGRGGDLIEQYRLFFEMLSLVNCGKITRSHQNVSLPGDVEWAIDYMYHHVTDQIQIGDIATALGISINTLERNFKATMQMTPTEYVIQLRLSMARDRLLDGFSVQEASDLSGFSSCSRFIATFKSVYGMTPFQYKKQNASTMHAYPVSQGNL